jgi:hypothetical protein
VATVKLDIKIANAIRKAKILSRYGDGTAKNLVSLAIKYLDEKHDECFVCQFHKDQVAGLELGRQKLALEAKRKGEAASIDGDWIPCDAADLKRAKAIAKSYRRTTKQVIEQAVLEHLTRPPNCSGCPFYAEMSGHVERGRAWNKEGKPKPICTKEAPLPDATGASHPDAVEVRRYEDWEYGEMFSEMKCQNCGTVFHVKA